MQPPFVETTTRVDGAVRLDPEPIDDEAFGALITALTTAVSAQLRPGGDDIEWYEEDWSALDGWWGGPVGEGIARVIVKLGPPDPDGTRALSVESTRDVVSVVEGADRIRAWSARWQLRVPLAVATTSGLLAWTFGPPRGTIIFAALITLAAGFATLFAWWPIVDRMYGLRRMRWVDMATIDEVRACASALELAISQTPGMKLERSLR